MSQQEMTQEQVVDAIYGYAAEQMKSGVPIHQIEQDLIAKGLPADAARTVLANLEDMRSKATRGAGVTNMVIGGLICAVGTAITFYTYQAASEETGYVVAWGAIVFGAIQFLRGAFEAATG